MEDLLEVILAIAVIAIGAIVNKKSKRTNRGRASSATSTKSTVKVVTKPAKAVTTAPAAATIESLAKTAMQNDTVRSAVAAFKEFAAELTEESPKAAKPVPQGASFTDEQGCIGGSMHEHVEEGETHAEHAAHMKRAAAPAPEAVQPAASLRGTSASDLRRAVIMSEILDKPVSLRKRA